MGWRFDNAPTRCSPYLAVSECGRVASCGSTPPSDGPAPLVHRAYTSRAMTHGQHEISFQIVEKQWGTSVGSYRLLSIPPSFLHACLDATIKMGMAVVRAR